MLGQTVLLRRETLRGRSVFVVFASLRGKESTLLIVVQIVGFVYEYRYALERCLMHVNLLLLLYTISLAKLDFSCHSVALCIFYSLLTT